MKHLKKIAIAFALLAGVFVATTAQNISGGTVSGTTLTATNTTNQLVAGTTNTTTLSFPAPSSSMTLTMPSNISDTLIGRTAMGYTAVQSSASLGGSPVTLTAAQCGGAFAQDVATGVVYILPATLPATGCTYDFFVTTSVTSNSHELETGSGSHFFQGAPLMVAAAATLATAQCNGTTHIAYKSNGTTTGGLIGTHIKATVVSATQVWLDGINAGSGSLATACSASN